MPRLVRITIDQENFGPIVEYGAAHAPGLTEQEQTELNALNLVLGGYEDFTAAEQLLEKDRQELMEKKRRFEVLQDKAGREHIEWILADDVTSILLLTKQSHLPVYVENLPDFMLDKLFSSNLNIQQATITFGARGAQIDETPSEEVETLKQHVMRALATGRNNWADLVELEEQPDGSVRINPKKFLEEDWNPINTALRNVFGDVWKSKGPGDKNVHWLIPP